MKSPRELLLNRHAAAAPKLDAIRAEAIAAMQPPLPVERRALLGQVISRAFMPGDARCSHSPGWLAVAWQELFWNSRRVWAGLAAVWAVLLVCNFVLNEASPSASANVAARLPAAEVRQLWQAQARLRAELLGGMEPGDDEVAPPAPGALRPRSARRLEEVMV